MNQLSQHHLGNPEPPVILVDIHPFDAENGLGSHGTLVGIKQRSSHAVEIRLFSLKYTDGLAAVKQNILLHFRGKHLQKCNDIVFGDHREQRSDRRFKLFTLFYGIINAGFSVIGQRMKASAEQIELLHAGGVNILHHGSGMFFAVL